MPFLLAEILNFQGSTHHIGVGSFSNLLTKIYVFMYLKDIIRGGSEELNWIDEQAVMEIDCMIGLNRHRLVYR